MRFLKMLFRPQLDVSEWLNNILFGIIMVLTTTALLGVSTPSSPSAQPVLATTDEDSSSDPGSGSGEDSGGEDSDDNSPQSIIKQIVGCNAAWGIINGGLLVLDRLYLRGRTDRLRRAIRKAKSDDEALSIIEDENEWDLDDVTSPEARRHLYADVVARAKTSAEATMRICPQDVADAIVTCLVVAATVLPVALALGLLKNAKIGFVVGNTISVLIMFFVGYFWARETNVNPWRTGIIMVLFGAIAVAVAHAMGG